MSIPSNPNAGNSQSTVHHTSGHPETLPAAPAPAAPAKPDASLSSRATACVHAMRRAPGWLSMRPTDNPNITYRPGPWSFWDFWSIAAGQAYQYRARESFHTFFEKDIDNENRSNPTAPYAWFFGDIRVIAILDDRDLAALIPHAKKLSHGPHDGVYPLGPIGELLTEKNLFSQDKYTEDPKTGSSRPNKEYVRQLTLIKQFLLDKEFLNGFARSTMPDLIKGELRKASQSADGVELLELMSNLAVKNGLMLILGFKEDDYFIKHREFLTRFFEKPAEPELAFSSEKFEVLQALRKEAIELMLQLVEDNYEELLNKPHNLVVKAWESLFQDDPQNKSFPESFDAFKELLASGTEEQKEKIEQLLFDLVFVAIVSSETTAQTICFGVHEAYNSPDWRKKIREEIANNEREGITLEGMDRDTMKHFPMLSAFTLEILDLYAPAPITSYIAKEEFDVVLSGKLTHIKERTVILKHLQYANRAPLKPKDRATFNPSRYLPSIAETDSETDSDSEESTEAEEVRPKINLEEISLDDALTELGKEQRQKLHSFSDKTRACPGRFFSTLEVAKTLGIMLRDFNLFAKDRETGEALESVSLESYTLSTMHLRQQIDIQLEPREQ